MKGRDNTGRFRSLHDRGALLGLVRQVVEALVAAGVVLEPLLVSQADFDQGRSSLGFAVPSAREICRRLRMNWQALKELALVDGRDHDKALAKIDQYQQVGIGLRTTGHGFDPEAVVAALRLVAARRGSDVPLIPQDYTAERDAIQSQDARCHRHGGGLVLPTADQISLIVGNWDRALELAGLPPRTDWRKPRGLDQAEALELCFIETGALATSMEIRVWCKARGFAYRNRALTREQALAEFRRRLAERGMEAPASPPPRGQRPDYAAAEPTGDHDHSSVAPEQGRQPKFWEDEAIIAATVAFLEQLPPDTKPTRKLYHAWSKGHPDRPNVGVFNKARRRGLPWYLGEARWRSASGEYG